MALGLGDLFYRLGLKNEGFVKGFDQAGKKTEQFQGKLSKLNSRISATQKLLIGLGTGASLYGIGRLAKSFVSVAASFEQMEVQLNQLTKGKGKQTLEEINAWALKMPVNTQEAVAAFVRMQAMGIDPTIDKLQTLTDVASIFGDEALSRVSLALGQMSASARVSAQDLNQLAQVGIRAKDYLREAFGEWEQEKLVKMGIGVNQAIEAIWKGMDRDFGGAAIKMMKSWNGLVTVFKSGIVEFQRAVMAGGVFEVLKQKLDQINTAMFTWIEANKQLVASKVVEYINKIQSAAVTLWNVLSYDPDIIEWGLIGLVFGGKKFAIIVGGLAHMANWAFNLAKAFEMASKGIISFSDIATSNFKELEDLVNKNQKTLKDIGLMSSHGEMPMVSPHKQDYYNKQFEDRIGIVKKNAEETKKAIEAVSDTAEKTDYARIMAQWDMGRAGGVYGESAGATEIVKGQQDQLAKSLQAKLELYSKFAEERETLEKHVGEVFNQVNQTMSAGIADMVTSGKMRFKELATSVINDILRMEIQASLSKVFGSFIGMMFPASASYAPAHIGAGGTTAFGMASGGYLGEGVLGVGKSSGKSYEFHPNEYVMPPDKLGGSGVDIVIQNNTGSNASVGSDRVINGRRQVVIQLSNMVQDGSLDKAMQSRYNLRPAGRRG